MKFTNFRPLFFILIFFSLSLIALSPAETSAKTMTHDCVIPSSGPWPPCATGGESNTNNNDCVIPPSGPWPPCATGGQSNTNNNDCVIPPSGPWPPCATGGESNANNNDCVIPPSGPWPPCATGGGSNTNNNDCVIPPSGPWPPCATGGDQSQTVPSKIHTFTMTPIHHGHGNNTVTVNWHATGTGSLDLTLLNPATGEFYFRQRVEESGSRTVTINDPSLRLTLGFLDGWAKDGTQLNASSDIHVSCKYDYIWPNAGEIFVCPLHEALGTNFAYQEFQHGTMIWVKQPTPTIYALFDTPTPYGYGFFKVLDTWDESQPVNDPSINPPAGLRQPTRGLGKVWREDDYVKANLGWATSPEYDFYGHQQNLHTFSPDPTESMLHFSGINGRSLSLYQDKELVSRYENSNHNYYWSDN